MAKLGLDHPERQHLCASASLLASTVMALRVLVVASSFNVTLVRWLLPTLGPAVLIQILFAVMLLRSRQKGERPVAEPLQLTNPLDLPVVLGFGALLAAVMVLAKALTLWTDTTAVMALAAASGLADVEAITLSMSRLGRGDLPAQTAALAILLAVGVNSVSKAILATVAGGRVIGALVATGTALAIAAGVAGLWLAAD
jgi:uncharacterized membrane protein (DUF4010 family)